MDIISTYTWQEAVEDGTLVEFYKSQWDDLNKGNPILVTKGVYADFDHDAIWSILENFWHKKTQPSPFETTMNGKKVWVIKDTIITILYPSEY